MKKEKKIHDRNTRNNEVAAQFILEECITRQISSLRGTVNCSFVKINEIQPKIIPIKSLEKVSSKALKIHFDVIASKSTLYTLQSTAP